MAANPPPFQVEDNSDEDFFDKLVDDDDADSKVNAVQPAFVDPILSDGDESDDAKAFANLSINEHENDGELSYDAANNSTRNEVDNSTTQISNIEQINRVGSVEESGNALVSSNSFQFDKVAHEQINKVGTMEKSGIALALSNSFEFDKLVHEHENETWGAERLSDATVVSKSSSDSLSDTTVASNNGVGSAAPGVKEVGWSAFHADSGKTAGDGFGSYSDFFSELDGANTGDAFENITGDSLYNGPQIANADNVDSYAPVENSMNYAQNDGYNYGVSADQNADLNSNQYWDSQYPGWKYDLSTGHWYQIYGSDAGANVTSNTDTTPSSTGVSEEQAQVSYLQQSAQSVAGTVAEVGMVQSVTNWNQAPQVSDSTETSTNWNQVSQVSVDTASAQSEWNQPSQENKGYPQHMVFDPQYPGWYYDTIAQEWRTLESYTVSTQSTAQIQERMHHNENASTDIYTQNHTQQNNNQTTYNAYDQGNSYMPQAFGKQGHDQNWAGSGNSYNNQTSLWQPDAVASSDPNSLYNGGRLTESHYGQNSSVTAGSKQNSSHYGATRSYYENVNQVQNNFSIPSQSPGFVVHNNLSQQINDSRFDQNEQKHTLYENYVNQNSVTFSQHEIQNAQIPYAHAPGRPSAGRPAHALVAFGFGGKLIMMKHSSSENLNFGSQNPVGNSLSVLNLAEVVNDNVDASLGVCNYFQALGRQSVPGPLTGGSVGTKELNKWIDERIANPGSLDMDHRKAEVLRLLLSLLKIACQYYGKLRSPYGSDAELKETDAPESAVARLFASAKGNVSHFSQYGSQCLQQMPSEGQMQVAATEVQSFLVSGRKIEALQCAQEGQLWGPALVLAAQLGEQFYVETVKQMALRQLVAGSPMRTLCLLIAGQPADVFSADSTTSSSMHGAANMPQQPAKISANGMLDDWEENLAVITSNRTKDDGLVLKHLGDCLYKERSNIIAAQICYLVAEVSFEPYSDGARLCLVGADHWKFPRTYASPEAIQRTEIYEYSKTLGNSQFVLLSFQPYKLVYAYMLAEVGRTSDALKYAQAVLKSLKTGRSPEMETLKHYASSLEERIKAHQQGGFSANLAPSKLVGKLLNLFDSTASRVVGGLPPPVPTAGGNVKGSENHYQPTGPRVATSQSTLAMSSLMPSQSTERNEWTSDSNKGTKHTRSVSEPDFGRTPRQGQTDSTKEASSTGIDGKSTSRFGRFGFGSQLLQKTMGLVLKPRQGRQAKLGDTNKFYYDEKLKRWVEEGAEAPAEEAALPPPPTAAVFQNGTPDYNLKSALQTEATYSNGSPEFKSPRLPDNNNLGIPPLPPTTNQYSSRGRMGVRSRYVDTFNQGGGNSANLFQSPSAPSVKQTSGAKPTFFMPTPVSTPEQQPVDAAPLDSMQDTSSTYKHISSPSPNDSSQSHQTPASSVSMQRFKSMNNISNNEMRDDGSFSVNSRRTASWSGSFNNSFSPPHRGDVKPLGEVLGIDPSSFMPNEPALGNSRTNRGSFGDDLQEVEL